MSTTKITRTRQQVSARLRGLELPAAFTAATIAAAASTTPRTPARDRRRLADHAIKLAAREERATARVPVAASHDSQLTGLELDGQLRSLSRRQVREAESIARIDREVAA